MKENVFGSNMVDKWKIKDTFEEEKLVRLFPDKKLRARTKIVAYDTYNKHNKTETAAIENLQRTGAMGRKPVRMSNLFKWEGLRDGGNKNGFITWLTWWCPIDGAVENRKGRVESGGGVRDEFNLGYSEISFGISFSFLGPHLWHMEVPRLGVKSECSCQPAPQFMSMPDPSPMSGARHWTCILMDTSQVHYRWATIGVPRVISLLTKVETRVQVSPRDIMQRERE